MWELPISRSLTFSKNNVNCKTAIARRTSLHFLHPVLKRKILTLEAELAKLREKKDNEKEIPGKTQRGGGGEGGAPERSWEDEARSLDLK